MKNFSRLNLIILLIILAATALGSYYLYQNYRLLKHSTTAEFNIEPTLTTDPTPIKPGPYKVCTIDYDFSPDPEQWWMGRIYIPVLEERQCGTIDKEQTTQLNRKFNLVIIAHADGQGNSISEAHLNYEDLATHLASNAMIVVSLNRYATQTSTGASNLFDQVLTQHLDYLYEESSIRNVITDQVAIIGHSAGGNSVIKHADVIEEAGKDLKSTILLAPTVNLLDPISFANDTESFLGIQAAYDSDANAFGSPLPDMVMSSGFKVYDDLPLSSTACREKDLLFITHSGHYFQNEDFTLAYVNAYLQLHLNGHNIFERFFKYQAPPPTLVASSIWQQHDEWNKYVLDDFEQLPEFVTTGGGPITFSGIGGQTVGWTYLSDLFSPHNTHALQFLTNNQGPAEITFNFFEPTNLSAYSFVGFRISQVYNPDNNATGEEINFRIRLNTSQGSSAWVQVQDHGGELHFPPMVSAPIDPNGPATKLNGGTKNAMRSYLIRQTAFGDIDLSQVESLSFNFGVSNDPLHLVLDDVAFYGF